MNARRVLCALVAALCLALTADRPARSAGEGQPALGAGLVAQQPQFPQPPGDPALTKIFTEIRERSELMSNLEYLSDMIGPRLTGSDNLKRANEWTAQKFRDYGLENVHLESYTIAHSWKRGRATARLVKPTEAPLTVASLGWSPGTNGGVRGRLAYVQATKKEDLEQYKGKVKGAIVILSRPAARPAAGTPPTPFFAGTPGTPGPPGPDRLSLFARLQQFRRELEEFPKNALVYANPHKRPCPAAQNLMQTGRSG